MASAASLEAPSARPSPKLMPEHTADTEVPPVPELPVTLGMPGEVADFLRAAEPDDVERAAFDQGMTVRHGPCCTPRVSATPAIPHQPPDPPPRPRPTRMSRPVSAPHARRPSPVWLCRQRGQRPVTLLLADTS
ncbi:hypothetical protein SHIRM173S_12580 [Streptomyces hirsutus]